MSNECTNMVTVTSENLESLLKFVSDNPIKNYFRDINDNYDSESKEAVYYFSSAWSPAFEIIRDISRTYPDLKFKLQYEESNMNFSGYNFLENGIGTESKQGIFGEFRIYSNNEFYENYLSQPSGDYIFGDGVNDVYDKV